MLGTGEDVGGTGKHRAESTASVRCRGWPTGPLHLSPSVGQCPPPRREQHLTHVPSERRCGLGQSARTGPGILGASQDWGHWGTLPPSPEMAEKSPDRSPIYQEGELLHFNGEKKSNLESEWSPQPRVGASCPLCPGWGLIPSQHTVSPLAPWILAHLLPCPLPSSLCSTQTCGFLPLASGPPPPCQLPHLPQQHPSPAPASPHVQEVSCHPLNRLQFMPHP